MRHVSRLLATVSIQICSTSMGNHSGKQSQRPGEKETVIFLLGKTGVGKSATANTIVGDERFKSSDCAESVTTEIQMDWARRQGRIIKVVDGPGLFDTKLEKGAAAEKMARDTAAAFMLCPKGIHSLVLVISYPLRFTKEEQNTVKALKQVFGDDFIRDFCIVIITSGDSFELKNKKKSFQEWCMEQEGPFGELLKECKYRAVLFHNMHRKRHDSDLRSLLDFVDSLNVRGAPYTSQLFEQAAPTRERFVVTAKAPLLKEEIQSKLNLLIQSLNIIKTSQAGSGDLMRLLDIALEDADSLLQEIREKDKDTSILENMKKNVLTIRESLNEIKYSKAGVKTALEKKAHEIEPAQAELEVESSMAKSVLIGSALGSVAGPLGKVVGTFVGGLIDWFSK